jgi:multiple sugar transport system permease protein
MADLRAALLVERASTRKASRWTIIASAAVVGLLVLGVLVTAGPFLAALWMSLKPPSDALQGIYLTNNWSLQNYIEAWTIGGINQFLITTAIYAVLGTLCTVTASALAGYAFARLHFPGRDICFTLMLLTMMIPGSVTIVPLIVVMLRLPLLGGNDILGQGGLGLYNTMTGLVLPSLAAPASIFLLRQFFKVLPSELEDAARIDGAGEFQIWWQVMLPLSGPGLATVALLSFQGHWNSYFWPLVMSSSNELVTMTVGLSALQAQGSSVTWCKCVYPATMAGSILAVAPIFLLFLIGQRYFRQGIALTGFK